MKNQAVNQQQSLSDLSHSNIGHLCQQDPSTDIHPGCSPRLNLTALGVKERKQMVKVLYPQSHSFSLDDNCGKLSKVSYQNLQNPVSTAIDISI